MSARRKPAAGAAPQSPRRGSELKIPLREILGVDPCNSRTDEPSAESIEQLARDIAAHGQLSAVLVRGMPGFGYRVLDGGRRWRALCWLEDQGEPQPVISACIFNGDDAAAREHSLAANFQRDGLHPLAEAEQFAELCRLETPARVARAFGVSERYLRQRVRLAGLPEAAKAAWRAGDINLPAAQALAECGDADAVTDLVRNCPDLLDDAQAIRDFLRPKGVLATTAKARFVGLDAYVKAGGYVVEDLFDERVWLTDVALLEKLANQSLSAQGQRICDAEGWGTVYLEEPGDADLAEPDYTDAETQELGGEPSPEREAEIERVAILRAIPQDRRHLYGIYVWINGGALAVLRGFLPFAGRPPQTPPGEASSPVSPPSAGDEVLLSADGPRPDPLPRPEPVEGRPQDAPPQTESFDDLAEAATRQRVARLPIDPALNAAAVERVLTAASRAIGSRVSTNDRASAVLLVAAAVQNTMGMVAIRRLQGPFGANDPLLRGLSRKPLLEAARDAVGFDDATLAHALRMAAASAIALRNDMRQAAAFYAFAKTLFHGLDKNFAEQIDYSALFGEGGEALARAAIRDCVGEAGVAERAHLRGLQLVAEAALLARAKAWIPQDWRGA